MTRLKPSGAIALALTVLIAPLAGTPAAAAPTESANGQHATTDRPAEEPEIKAPEEAEVGSQITITGKGFTPEETIALKLDDDVQAEVKSDGDGTFTAELEIPVDYSAGEFTIVASTKTGETAESPISVDVPEHTPTVEFSTTEPARGEAITITSEGHLPGETVTAKELLPNTLSGEKTEKADDEGTAVIEYLIPEEAGPLATLNVYDVHMDLPIASQQLTIRDPEPGDADADAGAGDNADADGGDDGSGGDSADAGDNAAADAGAAGDDGVNDSDANGNDGAGSTADSTGSADGEDNSASEGDEGGDKDGKEPSEIDVGDWDDHEPAPPVDQNEQRHDPFAAPGENEPVDSGEEDDTEKATSAPSPVESTTEDPTSQAPDSQADDSPASSGIGIGGVVAFGAGLAVLVALAVIAYVVARRNKQ